MRLRSIGLIVTLAVGTSSVVPLAAEAQQPGKVFRIGYLGINRPTTPETLRLREAFLQGLRELGYVEGQNIVLEYRWAEGKVERLPDLAAELVWLNVDVIAAGGTPPAIAAKRATTTIPIVMATGGGPVETGLIESLARPGGNVTGLSDVTVDLSAKRLEPELCASPRPY